MYIQKKYDYYQDDTWEWVDEEWVIERLMSFYGCSRKEIINNELEDLRRGEIIELLGTRVSGTDWGKQYKYFDNIENSNENETDF